MSQIKKQLSLLAILGFSSSAFAAGEALKDAFSSSMAWGFAIAVIFLLIVLSALNKALNTIKVMSMERSGIKVPEPTAKTEQSAFIKSLTDAVPIEKEADILLDHDYDGIKELDNNLPPWWLYGFYATIVYAIIYLVLYHVTGTALLTNEEFDKEMADAKEEVSAYLAKQGDLVDESNVVQLVENSDLAAGKNLFTTNCVVCHLADGGGSIGPNITDDYWLNGDGSVVEIFKTIKYGGRPAKGMLPWKDQMSPKQMQQVTSYVMSLRGTTPATPKDAEGELYTPSAQDETSDLNDEPEELVEVKRMDFDVELAAAGTDVFRKQCAVCHTNDGGGLVGPNLTDDFWVLGDGSYEAIKKVIDEGGSPGKGMIAWKGVLPDEDIESVTHFILSLRGMTPENPKAPEGEEYPL